MNDDGKLTLIFYDEAFVFAIVTLMNNIVSHALNYDVIFAKRHNQNVASKEAFVRKHNFQILRPSI